MFIKVITLYGCQHLKIDCSNDLIILQVYDQLNSLSQKNPWFVQSLQNIMSSAAIQDGNNSQLPVQLRPDMSAVSTSLPPPPPGGDPAQAALILLLAG